MKKMFAKLGMPSLLSLAFLLGGLFFGANSAQAQTLTGPAGVSASPIKTTAPWKDVASAKVALNAEISYLDNALSNNQAGNASAAKIKMVIYQDIVKDLEIGVEVPVAAYNNYYRYSPTGPDNQSVDANPVLPGVSNNDWNTIYNDMLGVLAQ